jgi:hypothetical protein
VFYIDHRFIFETQLSDLSRRFNITAKGMTGVHVRYVTKSVREDVSPRILRMTCGVSVGCDDQHSTLMLYLAHFDTRNTVAAATDIWNMILTAALHSEDVVHDNTNKGRIREADFYDFNPNSIGGYVTATAVAAPILVALISRCSYDFPTIVAIHYDGEDCEYIHHAADYIVCTDMRVIRFRYIDMTVSYCAVSIIEQAKTSRGNRQAITELPLFKGTESPLNAMQTDLIFLQQDETADFDNVSSFVVNLNNFLCSIIAGSTVDSMLLEDKMMNACATEATKIANELKGYMPTISYSVGSFRPLSLLCGDELSKIFGRLSNNHAVFSFQLDDNDMISLCCITDHYAYVSEVLYVYIATYVDTDYCYAKSALITNYFRRHLTKAGSERNYTTEPYHSQHPDTTTSNWCWTPAISADILDANKVETNAPIGGYLTTTKTVATTSITAHVLLTTPTTTTTKRHKHLIEYWGGG